MRLGGDYGGDRVLQFEYADGSTPELTAGGGLLLTAGGVLEAYGPATMVWTHSSAPA